MSSSLVVGDWVVAKSEHGLLEIEYALFDASDVLLVAEAPGLGAREQGYLTTAGFARGRLDAAGVNAEVARAALEALGPLRDLVRARAIAPLVDQLGPCEAFQGSVYDASTRRYRGAWLDLDAVAVSCPLPDASLAMQLLHLVLVMEEVAQDAPVRLLVTADVTAPAGARTWKRVQVGSVKHLPRSLATTQKPIIARVPSDETNVREELVRDLRARAAASHVERPRLHGLASAISRGEPGSERGTSSTQPLETAPEVIITDDLDYEPVPLIDELRGHTDMLHGEWHLREVAQFLTAMADKRTHVSELAILAARAWLASGEMGYARYFARRVTEDRAALPGSRIAAQEILESTTPTNESMRPPPATSVVPSPIVIIGDAPMAAAPPGASLPPMAQARASEPPIPSAPRAPRIDVASTTQPMMPAQRAALVAPPAPVAPPPVAPPLASPKVIAEKKPSGPEVVETMSTPDGDEVRLRMTQLARELARDYRLSYGTTLKTDPIAIEAMQRHLRRRFNDAKQDARVAQKLEAELTRHGALLSEILVRALGAEWTDTTEGELGRWAMTVPPSTRVWPIGRVYRYFQQGHRESDLLSFYFELEKSSRAR